jgi:ribosomal protein S18 acetylase RimI-like enzyme
MEHVHEPRAVSVQLRPATPADAAALADLGTRSFVAKFGELYKPEDLAAFLAEYRSEARYAGQLAEPGTRVQLAEEDGKLLAYCLLELGVCCDEPGLPRPQRPAYLTQLYCDPPITGRGIGSALMDWALATARAWDADAMQLNVFSENFGAQRFYARYGFEKIADIAFWVGNHRDDEFLYQLALS